MKLQSIFILLIVIAITIIAASCELKRSNPLDPSSHDNIVAPPRVTGLTATGSGPGVLSKYVELKWAKNNVNTDGYYIYRALAYNAAYAKLPDVVGNISTNAIITRVITIEAPGFYYFKVSAFTNHDIDGNTLNTSLEGPLSEWAIARVDN